jgi:Sec-independent protein translocase protein TatA
MMFAEDAQVPWWAAALIALGTGVLGPAAKWVWDALRTSRKERRAEEAAEDATVIDHQRNYIAEQEKRYETELAKRDAKIDRLEQRVDHLTATAQRDHETIARLRAEVRYLREKMSEHKIPLSHWDVFEPPAAAPTPPKP